jgi:hypothetical protein
MNGGDQRSAQCEQRAPISVGKESKVTDLHKADWEYMHEETANELDGVNRQGFLRIAVSRIPPSECDVPTFTTHESAIGDGNSVRVASEILQNVFWPAEWAFGINDPSFLFQSLIEEIESCRTTETGKSADQSEFLLAVIACECSQELVSKPGAKYADRKEKALAAMDPSRAIKRKAACRNQAVQVHVMEHLLIPCM